MSLHYEMFVSQPVCFYKEDVDKVLRMALKGGIAHWCDKVRVVDKNRLSSADLPTDKQVTRGGKLTFHCIGDKENEWTLPIGIDDVLRAIVSHIESDTKGSPLESGRYYSLETYGELDFDAGMVDEEIADRIVQLAVFGDVVYPKT